MCQVIVNKEKNRLYIEIGKLKDKHEIADFAKKIQEKCKILKKGYTCITDLRGYKEIHDAQYDMFIFEVQQTMVKAGLGKVVRVARKYYKYGHMQFDNMSVKVGYHAQSVASVEEAENILDEFAG